MKRQQRQQLLQQQPVGSSGRRCFSKAHSDLVIIAEAAACHARDARGCLERMQFRGEFAKHVALLAAVERDALLAAASGGDSRERRTARRGRLRSTL